MELRKTVTRRIRINIHDSETDVFGVTYFAEVTTQMEVYDGETKLATIISSSTKRIDSNAIINGITIDESKLAELFKKLETETLGTIEQEEQRLQTLKKFAAKNDMEFIVTVN